MSMPRAIVGVAVIAATIAAVFLFRSPRTTPAAEPTVVEKVDASTQGIDALEAESKEHDVDSKLPEKRAVAEDPEAMRVERRRILQETLAELEKDEREIESAASSPGALKTVRAHKARIKAELEASAEVAPE